MMTDRINDEFGMISSVCAHCPARVLTQEGNVCDTKILAIRNLPKPKECSNSTTNSLDPGYTSLKDLNSKYRMEQSN